MQNLVSLAEQDYPTAFGWSAGGDEIVYDSKNWIYIYTVHTLTSRPLIAGSSPSWSPDGQWIAYRSPDGRAGLISPDRAHAKELLTGTVVGRGLSWSPDGRYLLFTDRGTGSIRVLDVSTGMAGTVSCPHDGSDSSRLRWFDMTSQSNWQLPRRR